MMSACPRFTLCRSEDHYDHSSARSTAQAHGTWSWQPAAAAPQGTAATAPKPKPKQACAKCGAGHATFSAAMTCAVKCGGVPPPQPVVRPPPTGEPAWQQTPGPTQPLADATGRLGHDSTYSGSAWPHLVGSCNRFADGLLHHAAPVPVYNVVCIL